MSPPQDRCPKCNGRTDVKMYHLREPACDLFECSRCGHISTRYERVTPKESEP